ncbi:HD-GYP domain-containing protein [Omnitrophica bacterium]|nr:HD-GYP domain-containing protein [Candidatus Omnitrophota bacterium]
MSRKGEKIYNKVKEGVESLKKKNKTLFMRLRKSRFQILRLLIKVEEEISPYTKGHSLKVYKYAIRTAKRLRLGRKEIAVIGRAALLHDIGKIAIDRSILNKPGKLTEKEFTVIKSHPVIGAEIVGEVEELRPVCAHILYHHARYGGGGYPKHAFKHEDIPIGARIIAVADSYDAMISDRPYRKAFNREYAIEELKRHAGEQYDPKIVETFIEMLEEDRQGYDVTYRRHGISADINRYPYTFQ